MSDFNLITEENPHRYFTQFQNIVDDLPLSPFAFRLYCHIRRRAGEEGKCYENTANLARACQMSAATVSRSKKELKEWGLIDIEKIERGHGEFAYDSITIKDIWKANAIFYSLPEDERRELLQDKSVLYRLNSGSYQKQQDVKKETRKTLAEKIAGYPTDVQPMLTEIVNVFSFPDVPEPTKARGGKYAQWIKELRYLVNLCKEYGVEPIEWAYNIYLKNRPFIISHPGALNSLVTEAVRQQKASENYKKKQEEEYKQWRKRIEEREKQCVPAPDYIKPLGLDETEERTEKIMPARQRDREGEKQWAPPPASFLETINRVFPARNGTKPLEREEIKAQTDGRDKRWVPAPDYIKPL